MREFFGKVRKSLERLERLEREKNKSIGGKRKDKGGEERRGSRGRK